MKIPYVELETRDPGEKIQVIPLKYARFASVFYFCLGLLIGWWLF